MARSLVVSISLLFLVIPLAGQAADLQAGWYANMGVVSLYDMDTHSGIPVSAGGGYFYSTPPGTYGPFYVWGGNPHTYGERDISVPTTVSGVGADKSLTLPLYFTREQGGSLAFISFSWQTNYDASQMYLDLWQTKADGTSNLLWTQRQSGLRFDTTHVAYNTVIDGDYYFRLNVVSEPSGLVSLLAAGAGLVCIRRRK